MLFASKRQVVAVGVFIGVDETKRPGARRGQRGLHVTKDENDVVVVSSREVLRNQHVRVGDDVAYGIQQRIDAHLLLIGNGRIPLIELIFLVRIPLAPLV